MRRREIISWTLKSAGLIGITAGLPWAVRAAAPLARTPSQSEGPFYPLEKPKDAGWNLLGGPPGGAALHLTGRVLGADGKPMAGARVEIWQSDQQGVYDHPHAAGREKFDKSFRGFGEIATDADGRYQFLTQVPVRYSGRPPHIHAKVFAGGDEKLTTQLYIKDHPGNDRDGIVSSLFGGDRSRLMMEIRPVAKNPLGAMKSTTFDFIV